MILFNLFCFVCDFFGRKQHCECWRETFTFQPFWGKEPSYITVAVNLPNGTRGEAKLPLQLPYDIVKYLLVECGLQIDQKLVSEFWEHLEKVGDTWALASHEFRRIAGVVWPLGLYGDEAAMGLVVSPTSEIFGLYLNLPLFRPKSTRLSRYLLFSIVSDSIWSMEETIYPVLEAITISVNSLTATGINGVRFLLSEIRGDQKFIHEIFKHRSWWKAKEVCFRCGAVATQTALNYCIYDSIDGWRTTLRSTDEFLQDQLPAEQCVWPRNVQCFFACWKLIVFLKFLVWFLPTCFYRLIVPTIVRSSGEHSLL